MKQMTSIYNLIWPYISRAPSFPKPSYLQRRIHWATQFSTAGWTSHQGWAFVWDLQMEKMWPFPPIIFLTPSKYCSAHEMPCSCPLPFTYVAWKNILGEDILGTGAEMSLSLLIWDLLPLNILRVNMKSHSLRAEVGPCFFPWLWFPSLSKTNETAFPLFFLIFSHLPRLCFHLPSEWLSYYSFTEL